MRNISGYIGKMQPSCFGGEILGEQYFLFHRYRLLWCVILVPYTILTPHTRQAHNKIKFMKKVDKIKGLQGQKDFKVLSNPANDKKWGQIRYLSPANSKWVFKEDYIFIPSYLLIKVKIQRSKLTNKSINIEAGHMSLLNCHLWQPNTFQSKLTSMI